MSGENGEKAAGTPGERKASKQEEIRDLDILWLKIKEEFKQNEIHMENKLGEVQEMIDTKIEGAVGELSSKIQDLTIRSKSMEETNRKIQKELKEQKKETDKIKEEIKEWNIRQDQLSDSLAMAEMRQKQLNLKFRGVPEEANENVREKMIGELSKWLEVEEEEVADTIDKAFRIRGKMQQAKSKKLAGDCLVVFNSIEMKNMILRLSYKKNLTIEGRPIVIYKEIPIRFLRKRDGYRQIASVLRRNAISYRWDFPEGITFYYKDKRFRLMNTQEADKFLRRYEKELGRIEERAEEGERLTEERERKRRKEKGKERGEKRKEEEEEVEEEEEEGAVGGEGEEENEEETIKNRKIRL
ncbi:uncharacterized protein LOC144326281 [Podarcis muralis]